MTHFVFETESSNRLPFPKGKFETSGLCASVEYEFMTGGDMKITISDMYIDIDDIEEIIDFLQASKQRLTHDYKKYK